MQKWFFIIFLSLVSGIGYSQDMTRFQLYQPGENAAQEIAKAIKKAKAEGKNVFIQIGGNWCIWCARFHDFISNDPSLDSLIKASYVMYHLNYSKENYNASLLKKYGYPQRFGFPVFLVLNAEGKLIHTQDSWYLEDGRKSYDREKVISFFRNWSPQAFDPKQYPEK
jgi:thioredoxin-related protein